jgi:hypothetical protein
MMKELSCAIAACKPRILCDVDHDFLDGHLDPIERLRRAIVLRDLIFDELGRLVEAVVACGDDYGLHVRTLSACSMVIRT